MYQDDELMRLAFELAQEAENDGEVPVGAIIVYKGIVVGTGRNRREKENDAIAHAEMEAIKKACTNLSSWRLSECAIFVTLEPCPMCMGAIINARIDRLIYGAKDPKAGCCGSIIALSELGFNHKPEIKGGVMEKECSLILKNFFSSLRGREASA